MFELPLFPLNTVLFPGMPLHLHIFEDRYKRMIRICLDKHQPFGVVLIRRGLEAHGPLAEPFEIGCTARIVHHRTLDEGRMNTTTLIYLAAILLQVPPLKKQGFLAAERAGDLLAELQAAYRREIALLRALLSEQKPESEKRFSKN